MMGGHLIGRRKLATPGSLKAVTKAPRDCIGNIIVSTGSMVDADIANVLTMDEARRIAANIAKLPAFLGG